MRRSRTVALTVTALCAVALSGTAADWTQFRGPDRDGVSAETNLVRAWGEDGPEELWRRPIGEGFSTLAVVGERLFTLDADPPSSENPREHVLALDAKTGATLWRQPIGALFLNDFGKFYVKGPHT